MPTTCPCCQAALRPGLERWHATCPRCGYEAADLRPAINSGTHHAQIRETQRESGLRALREDNFRQLLGWLATLVSPQQTRLLEVGAAYGWFVRAASTHYAVTGIEPDHAVCAVARSQGIALRQGFFPDILAPQERFDVVVFNDVFEHLPDAAACLQACHAVLDTQGLLVLNLPTSQGVFYRVAKRLQRMGVAGPFTRMWQQGLPSPHLHYFAADNLAALLRQHGFEPVFTGSLPSLRLRGLYHRIAYTGGQGVPANALKWLLVALALPLVKLLPSDILVLMARKATAPAASAPSR